jgi:hypothetical protein
LNARSSALTKQQTRNFEIWTLKAPLAENEKIHRKKITRNTGR